MDNLPFAPVYVRDPRLAPYVTSAQPVWLWSARDPHIIWSNAAGAAVFGAGTVGDLIARVFDPNHMAAAEIARLAGSLHQGGAPRLERLRGFGTGLVRLPVCACSRITFNDQTPAVLVIGTATIGAELPFVERIRRLFDGTNQSIAVFSPDGTLVYATPGGNDQIGGLQTLADFGADALAQEAMRTGWSTGTLAWGRVIFDRVGAGTRARSSTLPSRCLDQRPNPRSLRLRTMRRRRTTTARYASAGIWMPIAGLRSVRRSCSN